MKALIFKTICALILCSSIPALAAAQVNINGARMWSAPDNTRVVFDVNGPVKHRLFTLHNPERVVIDMFDTHLRGSLRSIEKGNELMKGVRSAPRSRDDLRVVFDMKASVRPMSFMLNPNDKYGYRLVIDLYSSKVQKKIHSPTSAGRLRDVIVAIDAGHGGEDPGASGHYGNKEKDVVLAIARKLEALVKKEPGMKPLMIRDGDYFVSLNKRKNIAQSLKADMFISIHADSARNSRARGASVYVVSEKGASSEVARLLAESENATDIIGGVNLENKDDLLTSVLLDLSQSGTIEASLDLGGRVIRELGKVGKVHRSRVEQAGFVVLKSLGIPSILVETGFISNRREERKLKDRRYQQKLAGAILNGVKRYFVDHAPPGTYLAVRDLRHAVKAGETLSAIAHQYRVSLATLRNFNHLSSDLLNVGQVLRIPRSASINNSQSL
jgi:N-acetylmuramoyl-L-alanine amidase